MRLDVAVVSVLLAAGALAPMASADWGAKGSHEPDTLRDVNDGWMYVDPERAPTDAALPVRQVYLNGFYGQCTFPCYLPASSVNPNVATLQTSHASTLRLLYAMLGVWKDCNGDGYVGLGDQGLFEYRAELLAVGPGTSICKPEPTPQNVQTRLPPQHWFPSHNDGQWVRELLPIQWFRWNPPLAGGDVNSWNVDDNGSRVWADYGVPETDLTGAQGCWINPQPRGTYHNAGGLLEYADCHTGFRATDGYDLVIATIDGDDLGAGQLSFSDKPRDQNNSASILNVKPWGEEGDGAFVEPWDCGAGTTQVATPPQDVSAGGQSQHVAQQNVTNVSQPSPSPGVSASGSFAGTMNATGSGLDECHRSAKQGGGTGGTFARLPYANEGDVVNARSKIGVGALMVPQEDTRPAAPFAAVPGVGRAVPPDLGVKTFGWDGLWYGGAINSATPWFTATGGANPVHHITTYAYVSAASTYGLSLPKGATTGTYGREVCGAGIGPGQPIVKGWSCDPSEWYKDPSSGNDIEPRTTYLGPGDDGNGVRIGVRVGAPFNLRDVDCYDESVVGAREAGVGWGLLTGTQCAYAP